MRILTVVNYYPPHVGGIEIVAQQQARTLSELGHSSRVVTVAQASDSGTSFEDGVSVTRIRGWNILDKRYDLPIPIVGTGVLGSLRRAVKTADVVHVHDVFYMINWWAYIWSMVYGKPLVLTQHVGVVAHPSQLVDLIQRSVYRTIGRAIFRKAASVLVYNGDVKRFVLDHGVDGACVHQLRNGIDTSRFTPVDLQEKIKLREKFGLPKDRPIVLFVGRLVAKKGFDLLFGARSDMFDIVFVGSGRSPDWQGEPNVHLLGAIPQSELAEVYQLADLFVLPALGEIFTLAMQEAMAAGLPIVTTDEPGYAPYGLNRNLLKLVDRKPDILRETIEAILADSALRDAMSIYSREMAQAQFDHNINVLEAIPIITQSPMASGREQPTSDTFREASQT